jgi:hypothetical protein
LIQITAKKVKLNGIGEFNSNPMPLVGIKRNDDDEIDSLVWVLVW